MRRVILIPDWRAKSVQLTSHTAYDVEIAPRVCTQAAPYRVHGSCTGRRFNSVKPVSKFESVHRCIHLPYAIATVERQPLLRVL